MRNKTTSNLMAWVTSAGVGLALVAQSAAPTAPQGFITAKEFLGIGGVAVANLTENAKYPDFPDAVFYPHHFEWPTGANGRGGPIGQETERPPGGVLDNYGVEIEGYFYPPANGTYYFAVASDDGGDLYLSTNDSPANAVLIASEPIWNGVRNFGTEARRTRVGVGTADDRLINQSIGFVMEGNKPYYIRARMKEGGGGDNLAVAYNTSGPWAFVDGDAPIPGDRLASIDRGDAALPYFGPVVGRADGFRWQVFDGSGAGARTVSSATAMVDGDSVTVQVRTIAGTKYVVYQEVAVANLLTPGSTQEAVIVITDSTGATQTRTAKFTVPAYQTIPGDWAVTGGSNRGITGRLYQAEVGRIGGNVIWAVENTLANKHIDPATGMPYGNLIDPAIHEFDVVNWEQDGWEINAADPAASPDFFNSGRPVGDVRPNSFIPGVFGISGTDNIAAEIYGFIELPAGLSEFGVTSDDGFNLTIFSGANDIMGRVLGQFNEGRGASETRMAVAVPVAGLYPYRLTWWEGNGGASVEWYSINPATDNRILVNDPGVPAALKSYRTATGSGIALRQFYPFNGSQMISPNAAIEIKLQNGAASTVNAASISLMVNGATVQPTVTSAGGVTTISYVQAGGLGFSRNVPVELSYAPTGGGDARVITSSFTTATQTPNDLPTEGAFAIEAEDFNYDRGQHIPAASTMPYLGGAYDGLGGIRNIDFFNNDDNASDVYRTESDPDVVDPRNYVNMNDNLGGRWGSQRPGWEVTVNYKLGWVAGGDWQNYTRNIPAGFYNVFAALSYAGIAAGQLSGSLDQVTSDPSLPNQTVRALGTFNAPGSGGWGQNDMVRMNNASGDPAVVRIVGGATTLRFNMSSGDFDWFVLTKATEVPAQVSSFSPANGWTIPQGAAIQVVVEDGLDPLTADDFAFYLNDTEVDADISKEGFVTTISYVPAGAEFGSQHSYRLEFPGGQAGASFFISPLGAEDLFLIEAEDFNTDGGQTLPVASVMPYLGGAYDGLGAVADVDYASNQNPADTAQIYRDPALSPPMHFSEAMGTADRGDWEMEANYTIGWASTAVWGNYTRNIPAGDYKVWAALSFGGGTAANQSRGTLSLVSNASAPTQTAQQIGVFNGPGTGGWGANNLIPLLDSPTGSMISVPLGGTQTLRFTLDSGDFDYLILQKVGEGTGGGDMVIGYSLNAEGALVLTWEEGTLKSSTSVDGTYAPVGGATSPHTVSPGGEARFFMVE